MLLQWAWGWAHKQPVIARQNSVAPHFDSSVGQSVFSQSTLQQVVSIAALSLLTAMAGVRDDNCSPVGR